MHLSNDTVAASSQSTNVVLSSRIDLDSHFDDESDAEARLERLIEEYSHTSKVLKAIGRNIDALLEQREARAKQREEECKEVWLRAQQESIAMRSANNSTKSWMEQTFDSTRCGYREVFEPPKERILPVDRKFTSGFRIPSNNTLALFEDKQIEDRKTKQTMRGGVLDKSKGLPLVKERRRNLSDTQRTMSTGDDAMMMSEEELRKLEQEEQIAIMEAIKEEEEETWAIAEELTCVEERYIEEWSREVEGERRILRATKGKYPTFRGLYGPVRDHYTTTGNYKQKSGVKAHPDGHRREIDQWFAIQEAIELAELELKRYQMEDRECFELKWEREEGVPFWGTYGRYSRDEEEMV